MSKIFFWALVPVTILSLLFGIYFGFLKPILKYNTVIPFEQDCSNFEAFNLTTSLEGIHAEDLLTAFPYRAFLDSAGICDVAGIEQSLFALDYHYPEAKGNNREVLIRALTTELEERIGLAYSQYDSDILIRQLQWALKFEHPGVVPSENKIVYGVTYQFWMNHIANQMSGYASQDPDLKYEFQFKYVLAICQSKRFSPSIEKTKMEKVTQYLYEGKFSYLTKRALFGTNIPLYAAAFLLITPLLVFSGRRVLNKSRNNHSK